MHFTRVLVQNDGTPFEQNVSNLNDVNDLTVQLRNAGDTQPTNGAAVGDTIDTSADLGNSLDITDYDAVQLVFRDQSNSLVETSPVIPTGDLEISQLAYTRPSQQVTTVDFPSAPASDDFWTVKITDLEQGHQPFNRRSYEVEVLSSFSNEQIVEAFVDAINDREDQINDFQGASVYAGVEYGTNASVSLSGLANGDTFDLTIEGTTYSTEEVNTDEEETFREFVFEHGDTILDQHGVAFRVDENGNSDLTIYQVEGYDLTLTDAGTLDAAVTGTGSATLTDASMSSEVLRLTAIDTGDIFDVATRNFNADSVTTRFSPNDGVGTPAQISDYEREDRGTLGNYVQSTNLLGSLPTDPEYGQSSARYDLFTFQFPGDAEKAVNKTVERIHYIVALERTALNNATESNGTAGVDDFTEFFDPVTFASS